MREIRTSGLMSGDGKRGGAVAPVLAPILDSTGILRGTSARTPTWQPERSLHGCYIVTEAEASPCRRREAPRLRAGRWRQRPCRLLPDLPDGRPGWSDRPGEWWKTRCG